MLLFLVKKLKDKDIQYQEEGRIVWHTMYCIETLMENFVIFPWNFCDVWLSVHPINEDKLRFKISHFFKLFSCNCEKTV